MQEAALLGDIFSRQREFVTDIRLFRGKRRKMTVNGVPAKNSAALSDDLDSGIGTYSGVRAYARTKRMQVTLAELLGAELNRPADPVVHSMHPGWAATPGVSDSLPGFDTIARPILRSPAGRRCGASACARPCRCCANAAPTASTAAC